MRPLLVCKPKQTHVLSFMPKSDFQFWNKKKNMFTRKNNTFRNLRSKAKPRRWKNWTLSNRSTKIHPEGIAEGRTLGTVFLQRKKLSMLKALKTLL